MLAERTIDPVAVFRYCESIPCFGAEGELFRGNKESRQDYSGRIVNLIKNTPIIYEEISKYQTVVPHFDISVEREGDPYTSLLPEVFEFFSKILGKFDISGFCTSERNDLNLPLQVVSEAKEYLFLRVIFYTKCMKYDTFSRFLFNANKLNFLINPSSAKGAQTDAKRHPFSDEKVLQKVWKIGDKTLQDERILHHIILPFGQTLIGDEQLQPIFSAASQMEKYLSASMLNKPISPQDLLKIVDNLKKKKPIENVENSEGNSEENSEDNGDDLVGFSSRRNRRSCDENNVKLTSSGGRKLSRIDEFSSTFSSSAACSFPSSSSSSSSSESGVFSSSFPSSSSSSFSSNSGLFSSSSSSSALPDFIFNYRDISEVQKYLSKIPPLPEKLPQICSILAKSPFQKEEIVEFVSAWWEKAHEFDSFPSQRQKIQNIVYQKYKYSEDNLWNVNLLKLVENRDSFVSLFISEGIKSMSFETVAGIIRYLLDHVFFIESTNTILEREDENSELIRLSAQQWLMKFQKKYTPVKHKSDKKTKAYLSFSEKDDKKEMELFTATECCGFVMQFCQRKGVRFSKESLPAFERKFEREFIYTFVGFECFQANIPREIVKKKVWRWHHIIDSTIHPERYARHVKQLLAFPFKYPGSKNEVFLILSGEQGVGKSSISDPLVKIAGKYGEGTASLELLTATFNNQYLEEKICVFCNEIKDINNSIILMNKLKEMITGPAFHINKKFVPSYNSQNIANFYGFTNSAFPVLLEGGDRRYSLIQMNSSLRENHEFWTEYKADCEDPFFLSCLLNDLQSMEFPNTPMFPITTEMKIDLQVNNFDFAKGFFYQYFRKTHSISWRYEDVNMRDFEWTGPGFSSKQYEKIKIIPLRNFTTHKKVFCYTREAGRFLADIYTLSDATIQLFCSALEWNFEEIMAEQKSLRTKNYTLYRYTEKEIEESTNLIKNIDDWIEKGNNEDKRVSVKTVLNKTNLNYTQLKEKIINFRTVFDIDESKPKSIVLRKGRRTLNPDDEEIQIQNDNNEEDESRRSDEDLNNQTDLIW
jgi:hypothetical protein